MSADAREELADRIRALLPEADIRERRMFGTHSFMVDERLAVAAHGDGSLLVHVERDADGESLARPHASRPEMGAGRSMGPGWIRVDAEGLRTDAELAAWIDAALRGPAA